jgi:AcrR family transcriptional regulator
MNNTSRRGRRAGGGDTRETIRTAARNRFLAEGYQGVTLRDVASDAGVDVALPSYYFGSKQGLFIAAMAMPINPADAVAAALVGDPQQTAERVLRTLLSVWDSPEIGVQVQTFALMAMGDAQMRALVGDGIAREVVERVAAHVGEPDSLLRATAFTTHTLGLIFARYILEVEPMVSMTADEIVALLGPSMQRVLDGA